MSNTKVIQDQELQASAGQLNEQLSCNELHIWSASLNCSEEQLAVAQSMLSEQELARGARFVTAELRQRFCLSLALLRLTLAQYLDCEANEVGFYRGEHGKPYLENSNLQFNLSHSNDRMLLAVAHDIEVGIDIENMKRELEINELAARFFSSSEVNALSALPQAEQNSGFYRLWTRKEAYIKAIGQGLHFPLADFSVSLGVGQENCLLNVVSGNKGLQDWTVLGLAEQDDYAIAVAYQGVESKILRFRQLTVEDALAKKLP